MPLTKTQTVNNNCGQYINRIEGQILFAPMESKLTYLIDKNGIVNHTWTSNYLPGETACMLEDGSILRAIKLSLSYGGAGGGIQKISWNGSLLWDFRYYTSEYLSHHDFKILPNGNILMLAWEFKTPEEAIAAGRDPNTLFGNKLMSDRIIEVKPTGLTTGDIVWEWHLWDHLIQDYDKSKDNIGIVADHPELIDINYGAAQIDWLHTNSIDYNEEFDQILISVREFNEIWVIDHSTTTEEAANHTGGNSGKGGDILFRWGNPKAYKRGTENDQKFFGQHDATWIKTGYPGEGNILVFNNGRDRPEGKYSSIEELLPPIDDQGYYSIEPDLPYDGEIIWSYTSDPPTDFYSVSISGATRLKNGNTLICNGNKGMFFEVTPEKEIVWQYVNPYPNTLQNNVFKIQYIPLQEPPEPEPDQPDLDCEGNLNWVDIKCGVTLHGNFIVQNIGGNNSILNWTITSYPSWGTWYFSLNHGENLKPDDGPLTIQVSVISPNEKNKEFSGFIRLENQEDPEDFDVISVYLKTPRVRLLDKISSDSLFKYILSILNK